MIFTEKMQSQKMGFRDYIEALEEERRKIEVFQRELPLCLELVTQAIDACRQQLSGTTSEYNLNGHSECSEQTSMEGPVLEEFIPIKKRASPDFDENDDEDEQQSHKPKISKENKSTDKKKSDWLRSVQLWNPDPPVKEDVPRKAAAVEVKRNGGAFQPFQREESSGKANSPAGKAPASSPVAATSSTAGAGAGAVTGDSNAGSNKREEKDGQAQRKQRRCWSPELHKRFLQALQQLGGPDCTPKQIRELMMVDGLTNDEVKSHLQKYRLHTRRPTPIVHNSANPQTAPFVLVGNIFVQPPEYAAAVATTSTAASEVTTITPPGAIYAPVAAHPPSVALKAPPSISKPQTKQLQRSEHSSSEERSHHSNSPASSSSTHTTTNSSGY